MSAVINWWATLIWITVGGKKFKTSRRIGWHIRWTVAYMKVLHPSWRLEVIQATFSDADASAGTHNYDAVFDVRIVGATWAKAQAFLRACGWAAWWRKPRYSNGRLVWSDHIHMISIPKGLPANPTTSQVAAKFRALGIRVGEHVPKQVDGYYAHDYGLAGAIQPNRDPSWFPDNINATVWLQSKRTLKYLNKYKEAA